MGVSKDKTQNRSVVVRYLIIILNNKTNVNEFNSKVKNWDPVVSVESSEPRPWASKALKKQ
jgi:hypothetical protein